jgi:GntR family transcriptional repressor for pyruvate dehydrogenase complex
LRYGRDVAVSASPSPQLHQPRVAEMVAAVLREQVISGRLRDGDSLPRQEDLLQQFQVSKPSLREALRILEAEGLISVRRGNRGGAVVHAPRAANAAHTLGLVLQYRSVELPDVADAIKTIEPACTGLLAARPDREDVLVELRRTNEEARAVADDDLEFTRTSRRFHEQLVAGCGNETLILVVGALESLWSARAETWAAVARDSGEFPSRDMRLAGVEAHERLLAHLTAGDVRRSEEQARKHLQASLLYAIPASPRR